MLFGALISVSACSDDDVAALIQYITLGGVAIDVDVADLDGTDNDDFAVLRNSPTGDGSDFTVDFYANNGSGGFAMLMGSVVDSADALAGGHLVLGDLDADGDPDLAVSDPDIGGGVGATSVYQNDGSGVFAEVAGSPFYMGTAPTALDIGQVDGVDHVDLVAGPGTYTFTGARLQSTGTMGTINLTGTYEGYSFDEAVPDIEVMDLDGTGLNEIAYVTDDGPDNPDASNDHFGVARWNGSNSIVEVLTVDFANTADPAAFAAGDLDGSNELDIAIVRGDNMLTFLMSNATGSVGFAAASSIALPTGCDPTDIEAADLDDDGDTDLAVTCSGRDSLLLLSNPDSAEGTFTVADSLEIPSVSAPSNVEVGDFDGNDTPDLLVLSGDTAMAQRLRDMGALLP